MDRTQELSSLLKVDTIHHNTQPPFYENIYNTLVELSKRASQSISYKGLLILDKELNEIIKKNTDILETIQITGNEDIRLHFEGVKYIINKKIVDTSQYLTRLKNKTADIELEPQKPESFKKVSENLLYEQENRNITETSQYDATKQRLLKIEAIQKAIQENLILQDERIDNICTSQSETGKIYDSLSKDDGISTGSFFRRSTTTVIQCLSFVLIFVHIYYRQ